MELKHLIECLLFAASKPLSVEQLAENIRGVSVEGEDNPFAGVEQEMVREHVGELARDLEGRGVWLDEVAGGYRLATRPEYAAWISRLHHGEPKTPRLSQPALETLAVIAYRQPVSRAEIEAVRGVAVGGVIETLLDREVIRVAGRAEVPGRPLIYETTPKFLEHFGLRSLDDLPNVEELRRVKLPEPPAPDNGEQPELIHDTAADTTAN